MEFDPPHTDRQTRHTDRQTRHTDQTGRPEIQTRQADQKYRPDRQTRHIHRHRNRGARAPQYFTLETLLIFIHAAQIAAIAEYIMFGPPKMELLPTPMIQTMS